MSPARMLAISGAATMAAAAALCLATPAQADLPPYFGATTVATGLSRPTAIAWAPDGRMFIAQKDGQVRVLAPNAPPDQTTQLLDLSGHVNSYWDRGLLGIAVDTDFATNHYLYLLYTYDANPINQSGPKSSRLTRVKVDPDNTTSGETVLLGTSAEQPCPAANNAIDCIPSDSPSHSIGTVRADSDGTLWVGSGDGAEFGGVDTQAFRSYDESSMAGKIMHIDRNGNGLPGHPFCTSDSTLTDVCTKLYAKGFRNPFRFTLRSGGQGPALGDVGWNSYEELDMLQAGGDYGWPCWEGTHQTPGYSADPRCAAEYAQSTRPPVYEIAHQNGGVAIVGGPTYNGTDYPTGYRGTTFFSDYGSGTTRRWDPTTQTASTFATGAAAWVDLDSAPAGLGYANRGDLVITQIGDFTNGTGSVVRMYYTLGNRNPVARASASPPTGNPPRTVAFRGDTSSDPDNDALTFDWDFGDGSPHSSLANPTHSYATRRLYTAHLTVADGRGLTDTATVSVTVGGPTPTITGPAAGFLYTDGTAVPLHGSAVDEAGHPVTDLSWHVILHHSTSHIHDVGTFPGSDTSFTPRTDHDANSWYDVTLTATDSGGLTGSRTVTIYPRTITLTLTSTPPGATVSYAGIDHTTPFSAPSAVAFHTSVSAVGGFTAPDGSTYAFDSWSDGGAQLHDVDIPATDASLTARYVRVAAGPTAAPQNATSNCCRGGGGVSASSVPPHFSRVWQTHRSFAPARWLTPVHTVTKAAAVPKGTVFNYILDKAGTVTIGIAQPASGRRVGKTCEPPSRRNARKGKCQRLATLVTLTRVSHGGRNQVPFSGRIRGKALKPGTYTAIFTAKAKTGKATSVKAFSFRIARP
jgi:glucose/arabinose dehydrogenase